MDAFIREAGAYRFGPFQLDPVRRAVSRDGQRIKLGERSFDALFYLVANHGRVVEREELQQALWGGRAVEDNNLAQAIFALRKALQAEGDGDTYIVTVPGRGYRFAAPVSFEPEPLPSPSDAGMPPAPEDAVPKQPWWRGRVALGVACLALILAAIDLAHWGRQAIPAAPFAPPAHSVAVLAFENMTGDPQQTYVSEGLSEQVIDALAALESLKVAARTSAFSFRHSHATVGEIARKLNVGAVLEGSVRRQGSQMRVSVQLIDALTGFQVWSQGYDRPQGDVLGLQTAIAQAVAASLRVRLLGPDLAKLSLGGTASPAAYDFYLRAKKKLRGATEIAGYRAALADLDAALALDPDFARAMSARALALQYIGALSASGDHDAMRRSFADALAASDRAIALAPDLGASHSVRGVVLNIGFLDFAGAAAEQARAEALTPGSAGIETNYATAEAALGHMDAAVDAARHATQLDPLMPDAWGGLARVLTLARRYPEALAALAHTSAVTGTLPARFGLLQCEIQLLTGHPDQARQACGGGDFGQLEMQAIADHALGRSAEAASALARMQVMAGENGAYNYAVVEAQWGQADEALRWLETAWRLRDPGLADIAADPLLDPVRESPPFQAIARQVTTGASH
jgi:serine/threonine-protein kinase